MGDPEGRARQASVDRLGEGEPAAQRPSQGRGPVGWLLVGQGALAGICPEQVMEAVAELAGGVFPGNLQQLGVGKPVEQLLTLRRG
jgi:hypothetical protein